MGELAATEQEATEETATLAYVDQGFTDEVARQLAAEQGIALKVVKLPDVKRSFVRLSQWKQILPVLHVA